MKNIETKTILKIVVLVELLTVLTIEIIETWK